MGTTKIANVIVPEIYNPYLIQRTAELNKFIASGIASRDPDIQFPNMSRKVRGGKTVHIPFWKSIIEGENAEDEIMDDTDAPEINNIEAGESLAAINLRVKVWGANDLAGYFAGDDPMLAIADMNAAYWANRQQKVLLSTLEGVTAVDGALKDHVLDITKNDGGADVLSSSALIDAMYLMGDHVSELGGMACSSAVMAKLAKLNLIETVRDAEANIEYKFYMGKPVIVDDALKGEDGAHPIYFFGRGAISYNEDTEGIEITETDRDKVGGNDILISRRAFVMHPRGLSWVGKAAKTTPSNRELATAANWELADFAKNVPITKLVAHV